MKTYKKETRASLAEVSHEESKWGWTWFREKFLAAMGLTLQRFSPRVFFDLA